MDDDGTLERPNLSFWYFHSLKHSILEEYLDSSSTMELPAPQLKNLDALVSLFSEHYGPFQRDRLASGLLKDNYIRKLVDLFHVAEDIESTDSLHKIFTIFKNIIMLNNPNVIEIIFRPDLVMHVMGALEYDPDLARKTNHREFLEKQVEYKSVVPLRQDLQDVIHLTFRMQYMKDVVLPRVLDEATFATLNSLIFFNNVKIINDIRKDEQFLTNLFGILKTPGGHEQRRDALRFLREMCELGKSLEPKSKSIFYLYAPTTTTSSPHWLRPDSVFRFCSTLEKHGMFDVIEYNFTDKDVKLRFICAELTLFSVENEARQLRRHILSLKSRKYGFLNQLIHVLHTDEEVGVKNIVTDVLRTLLEGEPAENSSPERDLMTIFYQDFFKTMMEPLMRPLPENAAHTEPDAVLKNNLLDLLGFFVHHHGYRIKYEILKAGFLQKTLELLRSRDKHLVLASLRFFRSLIGTSDKFYCKHIVKENLFGPIVEVFLQYEGRYNLINSAVLELFAFLRKENIKILIAYFVQNFYDRVKHIKYVDVFDQLKAKYEHNESVAGEASSTHSGVTTPTRGHRAGSLGANRIVSEDQERFSRYSNEENYFESGDDDDDDDIAIGPSLSTLSGGLAAIAGAAEGGSSLRTPGLSSIFPSLDHDDDLFRLAGNVSATTSVPTSSQNQRHETDDMTDFGVSSIHGTHLVPYPMEEMTKPAGEAASAPATSTHNQDDLLNGSYDDPDADLPQGNRKKRKSVDMESTQHPLPDAPSPKRLKESPVEEPVQEGRSAELSAATATTAEAQ
jgi:protein phosphatase 4 regulatory subunit 3